MRHLKHFVTDYVYLHFLKVSYTVTCTNPMRPNILRAEEKNMINVNDFSGITDLAPRIIGVLLGITTCVWLIKVRLYNICRYLTYSDKNLHWLKKLNQILSSLFDYLNKWQAVRVCFSLHFSIPVRQIVGKTYLVSNSNLHLPTPIF